MIHFAFFKEIFYGLGGFFQWTFQILPPIGIIMNIILSLVILGWIVYWCVNFFKFGTEDKRIVDYREPHNFID